MENYNQQMPPATFGGTMDANLIASQYEEVNTPHSQQAQNGVKFDLKNYLNSRLAPGETTKTIRIRLLPFSATEPTPFHSMKVHTVRVNKEVTKGGWKTFVCPRNYDKSKPCPFCSVSIEANENKKKVLDESTKKLYGDIAFANMAKDAWFVRCIDRDNEADGVKFWMFNHAGKKKDGVYDKIMAIFNARKAEGVNIFDLNQGKDLLVTISKDTQNKTVYQITDASYLTPLTNDYNLGMSWINDPKTVENLYPVKTYDYMQIIVEGGVPVFDKGQGKYVDSKKLNEEKQQQQQQQFTENYQQPQVDLSQMSNGYQQPQQPQYMAQPQQPQYTPQQQWQQVQQAQPGMAFDASQFNNTQWQN